MATAWGSKGWSIGEFGTGDENIVVFPTGQSLTSSLNSVTSFTDVTVNLTGNTLTMSLNSINNQIWTVVNTGTPATWTEINTAA